MERIVVGVDGSDGAAKALRWASEESRLHSWPVVAVLAWSTIDQHHAVEGGGWDPDYNDVRARSALDAYVQRAVPAERAADIERQVVLDHPAAALEQESKGERLLVLGARRLDRLQAILVSSVSQQCLHNMGSPIAIISEAVDLDRGTDRVAVAVDGSPTSAAALQWALDEARVRQCPIDVLHSWVAPYLYGYPYAPPLDPAPYEQAASRLVDEMIEAADTSGLAHEPEIVLVSGHSTAGAILGASEEASLLVIGSRGLGGFRGMVQGSVSRQVTHHSARPVIVIPSVEG